MTRDGLSDFEKAKYVFSALDTIIEECEKMHSMKLPTQTPIYNDQTEARVDEAVLRSLERYNKELDVGLQNLQYIPVMGDNPDQTIYTAASRAIYRKDDRSEEIRYILQKKTWENRF